MTRHRGRSCGTASSAHKKVGPDGLPQLRRPDRRSGQVLRRLRHSPPGVRSASSTRQPSRRLPPKPPPRRHGPPHRRPPPRPGVRSRRRLRPLRLTSRRRPHSPPGARHRRLRPLRRSGLRNSSTAGNSTQAHMRLRHPTRHRQSSPRRPARRSPVCWHSPAVALRSAPRSCPGSRRRTRTRSPSSRPTSTTWRAATT